jgi:hypothetical protein
LTFPVEIYAVNLQWPISNIQHPEVVSVNGSSVGNLIPDEEAIAASKPEPTLLIFFNIVHITIVDLVIVSHESWFGNSLIFKNVEVTKTLVRRSNENIS